MTLFLREINISKSCCFQTYVLCDYIASSPRVSSSYFASLHIDLEHLLEEK